MLGKYVLLEKIGEGGMGVVYKARHEQMGRFVAVKILPSGVMTSQEAVRRFQREVRAAAQLSHPNIVTAYDTDQADGMHFLVMQYVEGIDLDAVVRKQGPLTVSRAVMCLLQAAAALQYAHEKGIVHRDVKPANLLLDQDDNLKVLDMGLARFDEPAYRDQTVAGELTRADLIMGSVHFMAPEQATSPSTADHRADIYGLGCTLYQLLIGHPPYQGGTVLETIVAHRERPVPSLRQLRPEVPQALDTLFRRMVAKRPDDRPASMKEIIAALQSCQHPRAKPRRKIALLVAAAVLVVCAGVLAGWHFRGLPTSAPGMPQAVRDPIEDHVEAHALYQKGLQMCDQRQERQMDLAVGCFQSAIRLAPGSARAYAALADAYNLRGDYEWDMPDAVFPEAKEAALHATRLNDRMIEAHLALAFTLNEYDLDWKQAEKEHLRALELNPDSAPAHHWYAWCLVLQRRLDEAEQHMKRAQQLAPADLIILCNAGKIHYYARSYQVTVEKCNEALDVNPDFRKAHWDLGLAYTQLGNLSAALREFDLAKGLTEDGRDLLAARAYAYARNGEGPSARAILSQIEPLADRKPIAYGIATIYTALGEKDLAFAWLQRAFREHSAWRCYIKVDPRLDGLRNDGRFQGYLKQAGLGE